MVVVLTPMDSPVKNESSLASASEWFNVVLSDSNLLSFLFVHFIAIVIVCFSVYV